MRRRSVLLSALVLLVTGGAEGCWPKADEAKQEGVVRREGEPDYVVAFDERRMDAAIAEARATLATFVAAVDAHETGTEAFAVKKAFKHGSDGQEFIWITDVHRDGEGFIGQVNNEPVNAVGVSLGDTVTVARGDVVDWMFVSRGSLRGGYTIVALAYGTPEQDKYGREMKIDWSAYKFLDGTR